MKGSSVKRILRTTLLAGAATAVAVFGFAAAAGAHVEVSPDEATAGGVARLSFQVPTESDTLSTTKVQVFLDTTHPIAQVLAEPVTGWTITVATTKLATPIKTDDGDTVTDAVSQVTWMANSPASAIKPGQFQDFALSLATLPDNVDQLTFKTLQTYSDGSVVRWIDPTPPGGPEPDHPAPVLKLVKASDPTPDGSAAAAPVAAATSGGGSDTAAIALGATGAALGLIGLILGALALLKVRNRPDVTT